LAQITGGAGAVLTEYSVYDVGQRAGPRGRREPHVLLGITEAFTERTVEALIQCLPGWLIAG
jgi:hypothetical protein